MSKPLLKLNYSTIEWFIKREDLEQCYFWRDVLNPLTDPEIKGREVMEAWQKLKTIMILIDEKIERGEK